MKRHSVLGDMTPRKFLSDHWQKKPLLIRQAIPDFHPPVSRDALFSLASRDDVESRLITYFRQQWTMQHGPMGALPSLTRKNWTLLVQGVDLHDDEAAALLNRFRFIPDARLDDLMISYATDAGGVGAHVDSYDVFLLQAHGQRRWRIGAQRDLSLREGMPLKILRHFTPTQEFVLNPGDMLYLPPHYAHDGTAVGECMTYSIGFRAPSWQELGEAFMNFMADNIALPGRYADPGLQPTRQPARIGADMLQRVTTQFQKLASRPDDVAVFLGEYLSEPKPSVWFDPPERPLARSRFEAGMSRHGLRLHRKTRMLYQGKFVFVNGASFRPSAPDRRLLQALGNQRTASPDLIATASVDLRESLYSWYRDGWLLPAR